MPTDRPRTLGELRASGYPMESVKDEMRRNLVARIRHKEPLFPDIMGYEETVVPQIQNAILSKHDILLLGLRGQACRKAAILQHPDNGIGQPGRLARRYQQPRDAVIDQIRYAPHSGGDHRAACRHRLDEHERGPFVVRGEREHVEVGIHAWKVRAPPGKEHLPRELQAAGGPR